MSWARCRVTASTHSAPAFWRFVRDHCQPLRDAIGNPRQDAYLARFRQAARQEQQRREEREAAEREAICADCGRKFTDDRWKAIGLTRGWSNHPSHPHLCEDCQSRAGAAQARVEADERERQEQERLRLEAEEQAAERKAGSWLSRFRT
ncbi:hypothetical protein AB0F46_41380 [Streptomyces sp. NPDC026665]|uniref:hypothetical protein n=1 Tax=Streptomyces sp. NPDC026665 TaxID=3154798 RepID=UPI0033EF0E74